MEVIPNMISVRLDLSPEELAATVEALHDTLLRRLKWTAYPGFPRWKELDWEIAHDVVDQLAQAYTKAMMTFRTMEGTEPEFPKVFGLPSEAWDLITQVTLATSWETAPVHTQHQEECPLCHKIAHV